MLRPMQPKLLTSTGAVKAGPGYVTAVVLAAGSDAATLTVDDSAAGGGTNVLVLAAAATTSAVVSFPYPIYFGTGIYATLTGTSPSASFAFE